jgi:hypothetical protein
MRAKIAGLPTPARLMLGLFTVALLGFIGGTFLQNSPLVAYGFFGLAGLRFVLWLREVRIRLSSEDEDEDEGDEPG